jgi:hypothetical protein
MVDGIEFEQVTTLVEGLDRVDFTTRFLDHAVSDRLVRVRFPVDQPGGLPLSEVASGVVGRGFGLIDADTAEAPWTLDNPANTWFGIGTTLAVDAVDEAGEAVGTRAVAVAEVVVADDADPADARDLVVALARSGVTATTSRASGSRYGDLSVDSNLPDLRFVLADGPNALLDELESRVGSLPEGDLLFVPALKPLTETWVPHADLRDVDALPVVVVRDVAVAVEAVTSGRLTALVSGGRAVEPHRDGTVALLTLGLPGFAVDPEAGLNLSLMRSCTGWPSGVWIDPPRRTTPDGSAFQLQHWTHEFHYALVSSDGDWRDAYLPARGQAFSTPLLAVPTTGSPGDLPATHSLLTVEPEREVLVSTVKAAGNPVASGGHDGADPRHSVTMRLVETTGTARRAMVTVPTTPLQSAARADLLEVPREPLEVEDGVLTVDLDGQQIETVVATLAAAGQRKDAVLGPHREEAQPVFSRYWLHNRGPAPMGFLPVSVAVTPTVARCGPGDRFEVSWVCSNQYAASSVAVASRLSLPDGWSATLPEAPTTLSPSGYARFRSWVEVPSEALPGQYAVTAQVTPDAGHLPGGGAVEVVEDVVTVFVGDSSALREVLGFGLPSAADLSRNPQLGATVDDAARPTGLAVDVDTTSLVVAPGAVATVTVTLRNDTSSPVRGEIQVASPWGTWEWIPRPDPWLRGGRRRNGGGGHRDRTTGRRDAGARVVDGQGDVVRSGSVCGDSPGGGPGSERGRLGRRDPDLGRGGRGASGPDEGERPGRFVARGRLAGGAAAAQVGRPGGRRRAALRAHCECIRAVRGRNSMRFRARIAGERGVEPSGRRGARFDRRRGVDEQPGGPPCRGPAHRRRVDPAGAVAAGGGAVGHRGRRHRLVAERTADLRSARGLRAVAGSGQPRTGALGTGYEHPGDASQPDNLHEH